MIKAGIFGGQSRMGGQLIRLLLMHPDIVVKGVYAGADAASLPITTLHRGLDGDTNLTFMADDKLDIESLDVLFIASGAAPECELPDELRTVSLTATGVIDEAVYGLPELNRKALVRGARHAVLPSAASTAITTALLPLARNLLLSGPITAHLTMGQIDATLPGLRNGEIEQALSSLQSSFASEVTVTTTTATDRSRGTTAVIDTPLRINPSTLRELYDEYFDDHNLTFIVDRQVTPDDVCGTAKCLISLDTGTPGTLRITSAIDGILKGSAAQAVHVMNLLMGLHEKTGLSLLATTY